MLFQKSKKQRGYLVSRSLFCYIISDSELWATVEKVYGDHTDDVITAFTKAYLYNFIFEFPFHHGKTAWRCADIPFFFGNTELVESCGIPEVAEKLEDEIFGALLHFARTGEPGTEILPWPAVTPEDVPTITFDRESRVRHNYDDEVSAEINKVLPPFSFADMAGEDIQH